MVGDENVIAYFVIIVEINRVESVARVGHSGLGRCWKSFPRDSKVWGDQEMQGKSNVEVSDTKSERLDSYLVLGKVSTNSSL